VFVVNNYVISRFIIFQKTDTVKFAKKEKKENSQDKSSLPICLRWKGPLFCYRFNPERVRKAYQPFIWETAFNILS